MAKVNPQRQTSGVWSTEGQVEVTSAAITIPGAAEVGDLVVIGIGTRRPQTTFTWPSYVTTAAQLVSVASVPSVALVWLKVTEDIKTQGYVPVGLSAPTLILARAFSYDGDTVDFSDPVTARSNANDFVTGHVILNPSTQTDWTDHEASNNIRVNGGAMAFHRANVAAATAGASWTTDNTAGLSGSADGNGLRCRIGFTHATGDAGSLQTGGTAYTLNNAVTSANAYGASLGWLVQGLSDPAAPVTGPEFAYQQDSGSLDVQFTDLTLNDPREWSWDFGDGSTSEAKDPTHTFAAAGDYTVVLTAGNPQNPIDQSGDYQATIVITVAPLPPTANFVWGGVGGSYKVNLRDRSLMAESLSWAVFPDTTDTGTPVTYTTPEVTHDFGALGDYLVRLTATNAAGSTSFDRIVRVVLGDAPPTRPDGIDVQVAIEMNGKWQPITCDVMDLDWVWGTEDDLGVLSIPGSARLVMRIKDFDRTFDPENTASEFYGDWNIGSLLRIRLGKAGDLVTYWYGFIADLQHDLAICTIQGDDSIAKVANYEADINGPLSLPQDTASSRLLTLLDVARWPTSWRRIDAGGQVLATTTVTESSVWQAMTDVQKNDLGRLMVTQDGVIEYQSRGNAWAGTDPVMLFGCPPPDGAVPDIGVDEIVLAGATRSLFNLIRVGRKDGEAQTYRRQESIDKYERFTATITDLLLTSQGAVDAWANHVLDRMSEPSYQGRRVSFYLKPDIVTKVGALRMGDLIRIYDDRHGAPIDLTGRLLGIRYVVTPYTVRCTLTTTQDFPLTASDNEYVIDTDTELAGVVTSSNTKVVGTGEGAVLSIDKA